jgi:hypothetical protein
MKIRNLPLRLDERRSACRHCLADSGQSGQSNKPVENGTAETSNTLVVQDNVFPFNEPAILKHRSFAIERRQLGTFLPISGIGIRLKHSTCIATPDSGTSRTSPKPASTPLLLAYPLVHPQPYCLQPVKGPLRACACGRLGRGPAR